MDCNLIRLRKCAVIKPYIVVPGLNAHKDMLFFSLYNMKDMNEVPSPKFVYVHLLFPHMPFMFDKNGVVISTIYNTDWNDYLGNYIFSIKENTNYAYRKQYCAKNEIMR